MSKKHTARIFRWQRQVNEDAKLPATAAKIVIYLSNSFNEDEGGMAWPSCKTIGEAIGKSQATVIGVVHLMQSRGHLRIEWGRQGRGRSNRYWMIEKTQDDLFEQEKPQPAKVFEPEKPQPANLLKRKKGQVSPSGKGQVSEIKGQVFERKGQPANQTLSKTHGIYTEGKREELAPSPHDASLGRKKERKSLPREESKPEAKPDREAELVPAADDAFARFWAAYPRQIEQADARTAFAKAIKAGADIEAMIARARVYAIERAAAIAGGDEPKWTLYPANWLKKKKWNDPLPPGAVVDEAGNVVAIEQEGGRRAPRRDSAKTWKEVGEELLAELEAEEAQEAEVADGTVH